MKYKLLNRRDYLQMSEHAEFADALDAYYRVKAKDPGLAEAVVERTTGSKMALVVVAFDGGAGRVVFPATNVR